MKLSGPISLSIFYKVWLNSVQVWLLYSLEAKLETRNDYLINTKESSVEQMLLAAYLHSKQSVTTVFVVNKQAKL